MIIVLYQSWYLQLGAVVTYYNLCIHYTKIEANLIEILTTQENIKIQENFCDFTYINFHVYIIFPTTYMQHIYTHSIVLTQYLHTTVIKYCQVSPTRSQSALDNRLLSSLLIWSLFLDSFSLKFNPFNTNAQMTCTGNSPLTP